MRDLRERFRLSRYLNRFLSEQLTSSSSSCCSIISSGDEEDADMVVMTGDSARDCSASSSSSRSYDDCSLLGRVAKSLDWTENIDVRDDNDSDEDEKESVRLVGNVWEVRAERYGNELVDSWRMVLR